MTKLKSLYAPWCGISDISALEGLTDLEYLNLHHNQIMNIEPLYGLNNLTHLNLQSNIIPEEEITLFYEKKEEKIFL